MTQKNKKKIEKLISDFRALHSKCCELMSDGVVPEYSIDICSIDEVVRSIENQLPE